jgi:hypothetical protein
LSTTKSGDKETGAITAAIPAFCEQQDQAIDMLERSRQLICHHQPQDQAVETGAITSKSFFVMIER